ncbi:MAG: hypothetical protein WCV63_08985 [Negativicutes bacterium]|jgi:hypothetical protein
MDETSALLKVAIAIATIIWLLTQSIDKWRNWAKEKSQRKRRKR